MSGTGTQTCLKWLDGTLPPPTHTVDSPVIRRRRSLQAKATFYVLVAVLFSSFDATSRSATTERIFTKSSPADVFAVLFVNANTYMKVASSEDKPGGQNVHFSSENSDSAVFGRPLRGNEEIRSGHLSLISCAF